MADDLEYYRNKCIQLQAQMIAKDKAHADECTQFRAVIAQLEAKIEENQNTHDVEIAALKGTVSALAAKNLGIKDRKKRSRKKSSGKHPRTGQEKTRTCGMQR